MKALASVLVLITAICLFHFSKTFHHKKEFSLNLGTRTPYRFRYNKNDSVIKYPNCQATKIWMLIRHGTRLPSPKDVIRMNTTLFELKQEILYNYELGKVKLSQEQWENLKSWSNHIKVESSKDLAVEGEDEMFLLARRIKHRFPDFIGDTYDSTTYLFRHTPTQRTEESAKHFSIGLFGIKQTKDVQYITHPKDYILRFYKHCDRWQQEVKKNMSTFREQVEYGMSTDMKATLKSVSKRLGFDYILDLDEVVLMYKICGFETSWNKNYSSPWCYGFDEESAQSLEYYHDLQHYWVDGYGAELTSRIACMSVNNMFSTLGDASSPNATFLFAHSGTLLKTLAHLRLYRDAERGAMRGARRPRAWAWRTSTIDCFAANLAFVLFSCSDGDYVLPLHQERPVRLPMCPAELCPLELLRAHFRQSREHCDYDEMCRLDGDHDEL